MSAENLFKRNLEWAYSVRYDLHRVHSPAVVDMLNTTADQLLLDSQTLSVGLRTASAYHEDRGCVYIANSPQRSRFIIEYNLLVANVGSGKSAVVNSLIDVARKQKMFDCDSAKGANKAKVQVNYRHATVQEFSGPGLMKALNQTGNLFIVIDEFDGHHQQSAMFPSDSKHLISKASAGAVLKSLHTGLNAYQKFQASENFFVKDPHVCFLGASNGAPILDILKYKIKNPNIPDAMVMRTVFDTIKSAPKFNATYVNRVISEQCIGWELFLLASSLFTNQVFLFENDSNTSANTMILNYMDAIIEAASKWDGIDPWISSRLAKTCELVARVAAQLTHIDLTMEVLQSYLVDKNITDPSTSVSFERYCDLRDYIRGRYSNEKNVVTIKVHQVEAAIYVTDTILLKYFNLFDTDSSRSRPLHQVPLIPPTAPSSIVNKSVGSLPQEDKELELKQSILNFHSIAFTRTMLYKIPKMRSNNDILDQLLHDLVTSNLLTKYERGVWSANSRTALYIKSLPDSLEQNMIDQWAKSMLDRLHIPWGKYIESCSTLRFPTATARFSNEVNELFERASYMKVIQAQIKPSRSTSKSDQMNHAIDTESTTTILGAIQSQDAQSPPLDVSLNTSSEISTMIDTSSETSPIPGHVLPSNSHSASTTASAIDLPLKSSDPDQASAMRTNDVNKSSQSANSPIPMSSNSVFFYPSDLHLSSIETDLPIDLRLESAGPQPASLPPAHSTPRTNTDIIVDDDDARQSSPIDLRLEPSRPHLASPPPAHSTPRTNTDVVVDDDNARQSSPIDFRSEQQPNASSQIPTNSSILLNDNTVMNSPLLERTNISTENSTPIEELTATRRSKRIAKKGPRSYSFENDQSEDPSASSSRKKKKIVH